MKSQATMNARQKAMKLAAEADSKRVIPYQGTHHNGGYRDEAELMEELCGRGAGDPDMYGYPGEDDPNYERVNSEPQPTEQEQPDLG